MHLLPNITTHVINNLLPNTRMNVRLQVENTWGRSRISADSFMVTDPDVPIDKVAPECLSMRSTKGAEKLPRDSTVALSLALANNQGDPVTQRRVIFWNNLNAGQGNSTVYANFTGENDLDVNTVFIDGLSPLQCYTFQVQSKNFLGWSTLSPPSSQCCTEAEPFGLSEAEQNLMQIISWSITGLGFMIGLSGLAFLHWYCQKRKFNATVFGRGRKKGEQNPLKKLERFMTNEYTIGVDDAPDIEVNPILIHAAEKARLEAIERRKKRQVAGGTGRSGGLKRLNFRISCGQRKQEGKIKSLAQLERYLSKHEGVDIHEREATKQVIAGKTKVTLQQAAASHARKPAFEVLGRQKSRSAFNARVNNEVEIEEQTKTQTKNEDYSIAL